MNVLNYIFWRYWRFMVKKEQGDTSGAYFTVTLNFSALFIGVPLIFFIGSKYELPKLPEDKWLAYLVVIPITLVCSLPVRLIFPKKKIFSLEYTAAEKKKYNRKILYFFAIFLGLIIIRCV